MKRILGLVLLLMISIGQMNAQILITKPGDTVMEKSAMLEVKSDDRGFLLPRMSSSQRRSISNPAKGLMVFDSTKQKMFVFTNSGWRALSFEDLGSDYSSLTQGAKPDSLKKGGYFGVGVALNNNRALVAATEDSVAGKSKQGAVYAYHFDGEEWLPIQRLIAPDGKANDYFGIGLAMNGDWAFIGSPRSDNSENIDEGSVYVFRWVDGAWVFHSKLVGANSASGDLFGISVSAAGNTLVVGASSDDIGVNTNQGSAYIFELQGNSWNQVQKIFTQTGAAADDYFGGRVRLVDSLLFVGNEYSPTVYGQCQNAVYVYSKSNGSWVQRSKIVAPDPVDSFEAFGYSLYTVGQKLMVGAVFHNTPSNNKDRGAVYVYERTDTTGYNWNFVQKLAPVDTYQGDTYGDYFGNYLSGFNDLMLASSHYEDVSGNLNQGVVYQYKLVGASWNLQNTSFTKAGFVTGDSFGFSTACSDGWVIVGAPGRVQRTGEVYFIKL